MRIIAVVLVLLTLAACAPSGVTGGYGRYTSDYFGLFDTHTLFIAYTKTREDFDRYSGIVYAELERAHRLFDIYNSYEGLNNLKTVNDNAGLMPVEVHADIIDLVKFGAEAYEKTGGAVNIAMGPVLRLWHKARTDALGDPENAYLPDIAELREAALNTGIGDIVIDAGTVFLKNPGMSLDVGAIAKGWAAGVAMRAAEVAGLESGLINAGGNVIALGRPMERGRDSWSVGIEEPSADGTRGLIAAVPAADTAVVTSGGYQRYYTVDGVVYNHIIDPETLMPAARHASVTVICPDAAAADMLSTALFIMSRERGEALLEEWGAEAVWVAHDGSITRSE